MYVSLSLVTCTFLGQGLGMVMLSTSSMERCSLICSFKYSARSALSSQLYNFFSDVVRKSLCLGLGLFGGPINGASESEECGEDALGGDLL